MLVESAPILNDLLSWELFLEQARTSLEEVLPRVEAEVRPTPPSPFYPSNISDLKGLDKSDYEAVFKEILEKSFDERKSAERRWKKALSAYLNEYDFGYKSAHQAKAYIPRITRYVEVLANYLRRALVENQQFFKVVAVASTEENIRSAAALEKMLSYLLEANEMPHKFTQAVKMGLLFGMLVLKVHVQPQTVTHLHQLNDGRWTTIERNAYRLSIDVISPFHILLDPSPRRRYIIQISYFDKSDLYALANQNLLHKSAVDDLVRAAHASTEKISGEKTEHPKHRPIYVLFEYWGDMWSPDGDIVHRNIWAIFGAAIGPDGDYLPGTVSLLRGPMPNPYWHQSPPFVVAPLIIPPVEQTYPNALTDYLVDLQREYTRLFNAMVDGAIYDAISVFAANTITLTDPTQLEDIYPGKILQTRSDTPPLIPIQLGKMPSAAAFIVQMIERLLMETYGVTETVLGYLSSRGRPTASEVMAARSHAFTLIEEIARGLEVTFWEPLLKLLLQTALQVLPDIADEEMLRALGDVSEDLRMLLSLDAQSREALARGGYKFRMEGMSKMIARTNELAKINEFLQLAASLPVIAQRINFDKLLYRIVEAYGWSPSEVLLPAPVQGQPPVPAEGVAAPPPELTGAIPAPPTVVSAPPIQEAPEEPTGLLEMD